MARYRVIFIINNYESLENVTRGYLQVFDKYFRTVKTQEDESRRIECSFYAFIRKILYSKILNTH